MAIYRNYERQDFSYLLNNKDEDNSKPNNHNAEISSADKKKAAKAEYRKARQDKLSNQAMKYAYSKSDCVYHDRSCAEVKNIPNSKFEMTKTFSDDYNWCNKCYRLAIIRCGIEKNAKEFERYVKFFKLIRASKELLHLLIIENNAKILLISNSIMEFKVNEDSWRISITDGKLTLFHNNYYIDKSGERVVEESFHIQTENAGCFKNCVNHMLNYSWKYHTESHEQIRKISEEKLKRAELMNEIANNGFIENFMYIKSHSIFFEKRIYLDCEDYIADEYFIKYNIKIKILREYVVPNSKYRWIICKVSKKALVAVCFSNA